MKIERWSLTILLVGLFCVIPAQARRQTSPSADQPQQDSLAAAARHAREQKKDQPKAKKVWDNDAVSELSPLSIVGGEDKTTADQSAGAQDKQGQAATAEQPSEPAQKAPDSGASDAAKANLDKLKNELDLLQRKYTLDQQSYYGKPDYTSDKADAATLQDEQNQIDAKQQEVDDAQKKLDAAQDQPNNTPPAENTAK